MQIEEKKKIVASLHESFLRSELLILTDYKGLDVLKINDLRKKLREVGCEYKVAKNTFFKRASEDTDAQMVRDNFKGPMAVALSYGDQVAPAKVLTDFAKDNDALGIHLGVMGGKIIDLDAITALSSLPSREVLLGSFLSVASGAARGLVVALSDVPRTFINVLTAIKEQKEAAA